MIVCACEDSQSATVAEIIIISFCVLLLRYCQGPSAVAGSNALERSGLFLISYDSSPPSRISPTDSYKEPVQQASVYLSVSLPGKQCQNACVQGAHGWKSMSPSQFGLCCRTVYVR